MVIIWAIRIMNVCERNFLNNKFKETKKQGIILDRYSCYTTQRGLNETYDWKKKKRFQKEM